MTDSPAPRRVNTGTAGTGVVIGECGRLDVTVESLALCKDLANKNDGHFTPQMGAFLENVQ